MNKKMFLKELEEIISRLIDEINLSEEKASDVYNTASHIIANEIKEKIKHPFKSLD